MTPCGIVLASGRCSTASRLKSMMRGRTEDFGVDPSRVEEPCERAELLQHDQVAINVAAKVFSVCQPEHRPHDCVAVLRNTCADEFHQIDSDVESEGELEADDHAVPMDLFEDKDEASDAGGDLGFDADHDNCALPSHVCGAQPEDHEKLAHANARGLLLDRMHAESEECAEKLETADAQVDHPPPSKKARLSASRAKKILFKKGTRMSGNPVPADAGDAFLDLVVWCTAETFTLPQLISQMESFLVLARIEEQFVKPTHVFRAGHHVDDIVAHKSQAYYNVLTSADVPQLRPNWSFMRGYII